MAVRDLLDQGGAARLDRDTGQDAAGSVRDRAADGLCMGDGWNEQQAEYACNGHAAQAPMA